MKILHTKGRQKVFFFSAAVILFLYAFRSVNQGIDVTDTGYHFSNFLYMSEMDPMWIFSTYIASVLGHLFTCLPGGDTLLGINIYTALIPAVFGVLCFAFFTKVIRQNGLVAFWGTAVALSLCWCPTTCLYNYLTYLLFGAGAAFLYMGLTSDKHRFLVLAGLSLGLNVMVRFPNLAEAALILAVWYSCVLGKEGIKAYFKKTGWCLLGYVLGIGGVLLQITLQYGFSAYLQGIIRLLGMTGDASDYTLYSMIYHLIQAYLFNGRWVLFLGLGVILGVLGFAVLPGKFLKVKTVGYSLCCLILIRWFYGQGMFSLAYDGYGAIFGWSAVAIMGALLLGLWMILSGKIAKEDKILAAIVVLIIGITPLGSNNQLYANINNMFPVIPFILYGLEKIWRLCEDKTIRLKNTETKLQRRPLFLMAGICLLVLTWQSLIFGNTFVFRDSVPRETKVNGIETLAHMKTTKENAEALEELGNFVSDNGLSGRQVILFGDVPALSAYLKMPFLMSPWPDLPSYSYRTFQEELSDIAANIQNNRPIIIFGADFYDFLTNKEEDIEESESFRAKYGDKLYLLEDFIETYAYQTAFQSERFVVAK